MADKLLFHIWGGEGDRGQGIATAGDALVNELADGTDLNAVWAEISARAAAGGGHLPAAVDSHAALQILTGNCTCAASVRHSGLWFR